MLAIELRAETRHRVKQPARQFLARPRRVIDMLLQIAMEIVDLASAAREPLSRIPAGVKFAGRENRFRAFRHRQLGIENCAADFQMRIERFTRNKQPHNFTRAFENRVDAAITQKTLNRDRFLAATR